MTVAIDVKRQALKEPPHVSQSVGAALQDLQLVVEAFDKAAVLMMGEVVGNQVLPGV